MRKLLLLFVISILLLSCSDKEEEYPFDQSPYIEFEDLVFRDNVGEPDVIDLSFIIWDREGDIGLDASELAYPFHYYNAVMNEDDDLVTISNNIEPPFYKVPLTILFDENEGKIVYFYFTDKKTFFSNSDQRLKEYSCDENLIIYEDANIQNNPLDTLYAFENKFFYNLRLKFLDSEGTELNFQEIFNVENCSTGNFDARLFNISEVSFFESFEYGFFKVERRDKFSWNVTYKLTSVALKAALPDQFQINFDINDRKLNESNIASSGLVTLEEITE